MDLGASSGRFAAGWLEAGRIRFEVVEQRAHTAKEYRGLSVWDLDSLLELCRMAVAYAAERFEDSTVGIDAWGVDHGFVDSSGSPIQPPVCYRDPSHVRTFAELAPHRRRLFELTGIQHQPFNTICQLAARTHDSPQVAGARWLLLPDLLSSMLGGTDFCELTEASTTQLLGLDGRWSPEAFSIAGWPVPPMEPKAPGVLDREIANGVRLARVGSHDTASAVCGIGELGGGRAFLNLGTWSLIGTTLDEPIATAEAEDAGFTNERAVDGRVRFLKNIPGFYIVNRLHEDLGLRGPVSEWLATANEVTPIRIDVLSPELFNPESMLSACTAQLGGRSFPAAEWAGIALASMADAVAAEMSALERVTGRAFTELCIAGGGSRSEILCRLIAGATGRRIVPGSTEATVLGNLAMQFLASGAFADRHEMNDVILRSAGSHETAAAEAK